MYVWLEKYFSRGDYHRPVETMAAAAPRPEERAI
jgi:hypothetical protein